MAYRTLYRLRAPISARLIAGVLTCIICGSIFSLVRWYTYRTYLPPALTFLSDDVPLAPPPPLGTDREPVRIKLEAVRAAQGDFEKQSSNFARLLDLGRQAVNGGDPLLARSALSKAIQISPPSDPAVFNALGTCQSDLGLYREAAETYRAMIRAAPRDAAGYIGLSRALAAQHKNEESAGELATASRAIQRHDARGRLAIAAEYDARFQSVQALEEANQAMKEAPTDAGVSLSVAGLLLKLGRQKDAYLLLHPVLTERPLDPFANRLMGQLESEPGSSQLNAQRAEHHFLNALKADNHDSKAASRLSSLYLEQHRFTQAAYIATLWLHAAPNSGSARMTLATAYRGINRVTDAQFQQAIAQHMLELEREIGALSIKRDRVPSDATIRAQLARAYVNIGNYGEALVQAEAAICLKPSLAEARGLLAKIYSDIGIRPPSSRELAEWACPLN